MKHLWRSRRTSGGAALAAILLVAGCSDATSPVTRRADVVEAAAPAVQSAREGSAVASPPAVLVRDADGGAVAGRIVEFRVTRGGGSVAASAALTNADGVASAGRWTLGTAGENEVRAVVGGSTVVFLASATAAPAAPAPQPTLPTAPAPVSAFDIRVQYIGTATPRQQQAVASAVARWRSVIVGELANIPVTLNAGDCFEQQPAVNEVVDDLLLFVAFEPIDGAGKVLGAAGPCIVRSSNGLPVVGYLNLDAADLLGMESAGTLDDVVLHEVGHVLGIGTLWTMAGLLTGSGGEDPQFTGGSALAAYRGLGGALPGVPVENTGSAGTRDGHWRESVFGNELMTGYIRAGGNPLSSLTIASLTDLGYGATQSAASEYRAGGSSAGVQQALDLHRRERVARPKYRMDERGRKHRLPQP